MRAAARSTRSSGTAALGAACSGPDRLLLDEPDKAALRIDAKSDACLLHDRHSVQPGEAVEGTVLVQDILVEPLQL